MLKGGIAIILTFFLLNIHGYGKTNSFIPDSIDVENSDHLINYSAQLISQGELELAKKVLDFSFNLGKKNKDLFLLANSNYYKADYFYYRNEFDSAQVLYNIVLPQFEELKDTLMLAKTLNSIGLLYSFKQDNERSLHYYLLEDDLLNKSNINTPKYNTERIVLLTNLINLYSSEKEHNKVVEFSIKGIALAKQINDLERLGSILNTLAIAYKNLGELDLALKTFREASLIFRGSNDDFHNAFILNNIGGHYEKDNLNLDSAYFYYSEALNGFERANYEWGKTQAKLGIASILSKTKKFNEAEPHYQYIIDTSLVYQFNQILLSAYQGMAQLKYDSKKYKEAYEYNILYNQLNDSLFSAEKYNQYLELQTKYETSQKENEINLLRTEKVRRELILKKAEIHKQIGIYSLGFILIVFVIIIVYYNQKKNDNKVLTEKNLKIEQQNEQLQNMNQHIRLINNKIQKSKMELSKSNQAKNKFFSILAHDLRNPFHTIIGQSYLLSETYEKLSDLEKINYARDIHKSCTQVNRLLENLLEWNSTQTNGITFNPKPLTLFDSVQNSISTLQHNANEKAITIHNHIDLVTAIFADKEMLETVLRNVVNNSIKFTKQGGNVYLSFKQTKNKTRIIIEDTGIGIDANNLDKLFSIDSNFKTLGTNEERGTGLGLVICKEFISIHKGKIWAKSVINKGSIFYIEFPNQKKS